MYPSGSGACSSRRSSTTADPPRRPCSAADSQGPRSIPRTSTSPLELERELRAALRKPIGATRLTVTGGSARHRAVLRRLGRVDFMAMSSCWRETPRCMVASKAMCHARWRHDRLSRRLDRRRRARPSAAAIHKVGNGTISGTEQTLDAAVEPLRPARSHCHPDCAACRRARRAAADAHGAGIRPRDVRAPQSRDRFRYGRPLVRARFLAGLLGQVLVLPTFGMLVIGLALTIAGALLLPFAIAVYLVLVLVTTLWACSPSRTRWASASPGGAWRAALRCRPMPIATSRPDSARWRSSGWRGWCSAGSRSRER